METPIKPLRGIEIVRKLMEVKKQAQQATIDNYRNTSEVYNMNRDQKASLSWIFPRVK